LQVFKDIEACFGTKAKPMLDRLAPPATAADLAALAALELPDALLWSLKIHNGGLRLWDYDVFAASELSSSSEQAGACAIGKSPEGTLLCVEPDASLSARGSGGSCLSVGSSFGAYLQAWRDALLSRKVEYLD
jgi:hypothetical protein